MAPNDKVLLAASFNDWKKRISETEDDIQPWLYFCLSLFLKSFDDDELRAGLTEGGNDGAIDAHYFIVNHRLMISEGTSVEPKTVSKIDLMFFQVKTSGGFKPTEIEKWIPLVDDFFDLSVTDQEAYGERYNSKTKKAMDLWKKSYIRFSTHIPEVSVNFYYITGDDEFASTYAKDAGRRVEARVEAKLGCKCTVNFIAAHELWQQAQKRALATRVLTWVGTPMSTADAAYVGLVKLTDFRAFLEEAPAGSNILEERIFESNVRGYQQDTPVNKDIIDSVKNNTETPNFWLLNNGVTIIVSDYQPAHGMLTVVDPQIVNGLQTSRVVFDNVLQGDSRAVLVRVIKTTDQEIQDKIIRATNNQNKMLASSLRMTDTIHRDIEQFFKGHDLFYDRKKGFHKDAGRPIKKIVSASAQAQAIISVILQRPDDARGRPGDYFINDAQYESVFGDQSIPIEAYLRCVRIVQAADAFLAKNGYVGIERRNLVFYLAAMSARELAKTQYPPSKKLPDLSKFTDAHFSTVLKNILKFYKKLRETLEGDAIARGPILLKKLDAQWIRRRKNAKKKRLGG